MRRIALWFLTAGLAGVIAGAGPARGATTRSYAVLSSGERIGKLEVVTSGKVVDLDWRIDRADVHRQRTADRYVRGRQSVRWTAERQRQRFTELDRRSAAEAQHQRHVDVPVQR